MPSKKQPQANIANWPEADAALGHLGREQRDRARIIAQAQAKIDGIKAQAAVDVAAHNAAVKSLTRLLTRFVEANASDLDADGVRTRKLMFGRLGFRTPPASLQLMEGVDEEHVVLLLKERYPKNWQQFVRVAEKLKKDELKLLDEGDLNLLGLQTTQDEEIVIEPAEDVETASEVA